MRRFGFWLAVCAFVLGVSAMGAPAASAHARLKTSEPAANAAVAQPPAQVTLTFSEETSATKSGGSVTDASGAMVSTGAKVDLNDRTKMTIALKPGLGPGVYTVQYNTLTEDDGGMVNDHFTFTVGPGGAAPVVGATTAATSAPAATTVTGTVAVTRGPSVTLVPAVGTPVSNAASASTSTTGAGGGGGIPAVIWVLVAVVVVAVIAFGARLVTARR